MDRSSADESTVEGDLAIASKMRTRWQNIANRSKLVADPWSKFRLEDLPTETAKRHRYNAREQSWVVDKILVKLDTTSFASGAMRKCYRMKKLSNFADERDWHKAQNYVSKEYLKPVDRDTYINDVKLQMDAKLWAEAFNSSNPPKKVDIFQMYFIELEGREGCPIFCVEHLIEGSYKKYNSNSGFVLGESGEDVTRNTPQAFSHFSFEKSNHELIVVDIQGVGDLYTDPQLHTAAGTEYGEANLGIRGIALFFHTHECNAICRQLKLPEFKLTSAEKKSMKLSRKHVDTTVATRMKLMSLRSMRLSKYNLASGHLLADANTSVCLAVTTPPGTLVNGDLGDLGPSVTISKPYKQRTIATTFMNSSSLFPPSPSATPKPLNSYENNNSILQDDMTNGLFTSKKPPVIGFVHYELAQLHSLGSFLDNDSATDQQEEPDWESCLFHISVAASLGVFSACLTLRLMHLGNPHALFESLDIEMKSRDPTIGHSAVLIGAQRQSRACMLALAEDLEFGIGCERDWQDAFYWLNLIAETPLNEKYIDMELFPSQPLYMVLAKMAALLSEGGFLLDRDVDRAVSYYHEAAEAAMKAGKGKLAAKYYENSEMLYGSSDD